MKTTMPIGPSPRPPHTPFVPPCPAWRRLRAFAVDPSLATQLDTQPISVVALSVPWERLKVGPTGEYLEVIDVDPGSGCFYEAINLDDPSLLAQDGLRPSEGTPQFHQQMVYAVASLTIHNFEHALGRRTLWRPGPSPDPARPKDDSLFVQRLRIHPHALRQRNAYYSPQKIALLFGYFRASMDTPGDHMAGGMVFSCLSHDIVAHETTHALLDGMHRSLTQASNPDVLAFHEAFADIVALFQHFTFPELLRHQIAGTRGEIRWHQNVLSELAGEFGRGMGLRQALRSSIGEFVDGKWVPREPNPADYETVKEPHQRGAILVAAVFDAFLSIYEHRTADLLRLASGGSGILRPGAIHPDLVNRLANEASKAAGHVLTMCIRALDYCPPTDITFGEYLRALITADFDLVEDDDLNYRVAFIEAFRKCGLYPRDLRSLSVGSLIWRGPDDDDFRPSPELESGLMKVRTYLDRHLYTESRREVFDLERILRRDIHEWLKGHLTTSSQGKNDACYLGFDADVERPFEVRAARFAYRWRPDGGMIPQLIVTLLQVKSVPVDEEDPSGPQMSLEGGCTLVADLRQGRIRYCIRKNLNSSRRRERQQLVAKETAFSPQSIYFGAHGLYEAEPFAALHQTL